MEIKKSSLIYLISFMVLFYACEDNMELIEPNEETPLITASSSESISLTENGLLNFNSMAVFTSTIMEIKDMKPIEIAEWNKQYNFVSLQSIYNKALEEEESLVTEFETFIEIMMEVKTEEEANKFRKSHGKELASFQNKVAAIQTKYGDYVNFENGRINGIKTYDPIMAGLLNSQGLVKVDGTILQYTESQLKVMTGSEDIELLLNSKEADAENGISFRQLTTDNQLSSRTEEDKVLTNSCSTQFGPKGKMTGNSTVRNTVVPVYRRVWVPRVCRTICDPGDGDLIPIGNPGDPTPIGIDEDCYESCSGGYYRNELDRYNVLSTRLEATIRNYKIVCFFGCWENWKSRVSRLKISGAHTETVQLGNVEKSGWTRDISPRQSGTFTVTYECDDSYNGSCFTHIAW